MTNLKAIHSIVRTHPDATGLVVNGYDAQGEPNMRVRSQTLQPGEMFAESNPIVIAELLAAGAARELDDAEREVFERIVA